MYQNNPQLSAVVAVASSSSVIPANALRSITLVMEFRSALMVAMKALRLINIKYFKLKMLNRRLFSFFNIKCPSTPTVKPIRKTQHSAAETIPIDMRLAAKPLDQQQPLQQQQQIQQQLVANIQRAEQKVGGMHLFIHILYGCGSVSFRPKLAL